MKTIVVIPTYDEKDRCIKLAEYLIDNNSTVRATAKHFGISKSTVHKDVTEKLSYINPPLFSAVREILDKNKSERHIRGGMATKTKYLIENKKNRKVDKRKNIV